MLHANGVNAVVSFMVLAGLLGSFPTAALAVDDLKPFPESKNGYRRIVIRLPEVDAPDDRRVEFIFGKMTEIADTSSGPSFNLHCLDSTLPYLR